MSLQVIIKSARKRETEAAPLSSVWGRVKHVKRINNVQKAAEPKNWCIELSLPRQVK